MIQYQCQMCNVFFLIKANFEAHRTKEIPKFIEASAIKNREYESKQRAWKELNGYPIERISHFRGVH